ncbi:MAG TPA: FTR1 family protein [Solirubrobacterales bacterium]|nr:FTR1 family protein [Solirubrobacterales bacterium]
MRRAALIAVAAGALLVAPAARADAPWQAAEKLRAGLFEAQTALLLDRGRGAEAGVSRASAAAEGRLAAQLRREAPTALARLRRALAQAGRAAAEGAEVSLATARGQAIAAVRAGAFALTVAATERGDLPEARQWLLIREFRQATRFTRPGADATEALERLEDGGIQPGEAVTAIRKDLLDAYQARLVTYLDEAAEARKRGFAAAFAENAATAAGYWQILAPVYESHSGAAARADADRIFERLDRAARTGQAADFFRARNEAIAILDGFTAAPFTTEEQARRANQLTRFLELVPVEYDHGTEGERVTIPFEIQEAIAFVEGARSAFGDLDSALSERNPAAVAEVDGAIAELDRITREANEGGEVVPLDRVEEIERSASDTLDRILPAEWKESDAESDLDLVAISLDQMEAAVSAGERDRAEQARLAAYAFFEFGPELQLKATAPSLVNSVEGLVWYGADGHDGLAQLIASGASVRDVRVTRIALDERLEEARSAVGEGASTATVITNSALIVFREGLEAILIIAAITASMVGANRGLRRPIYRGALLALPATMVLFLIAITILDSLSRYGEKLEAVVGLIAIGVLLIVLNWFFHRVYWTEWIAGHRKRGKALAAGAGAAGAAVGATIFGLYMLGFSSVFREGFETVLFLQALQLSSGTGVVLGGVALGLALTAAVGAATFALERRLPYKKMLIVTGVLIALVLTVMVGNTVRVMQGVGWLPITPLDVELPLWMGTWLGIFPSWQTIGAQLGALVFVIGSYFVAERVRKRTALRTKPRRAPAGSPSEA